MTIPWMIALFGSAVLLVLPWILRRETQRLRSAELYRDKFRRSAQPLLEDSDTPLLVVHVIGMMHGYLDSPSFVRAIFWDALTGRLGTVTRETSSGSMKQVETLRPELKKAFAELAVNFLIANSFSNPFLGPLLRRVMLVFAKDSEKSTSRVATWEVERREDFANKNGPTRAAA